MARLRSLVASLMIAGALTPGVTAGATTVSADVRLLDTVALGMGGSGDPIPSAELIDYVKTHFAEPNPLYFPGQPVFSANTINPLFTPEGLYPLTGVKSLPLDTSVAQGVTILNSAITGQLAEHNDVVVVGGSQSSTIASLEMRDLLALPSADQPTADQLSFLLLVHRAIPTAACWNASGTRACRR